MASHTANSLGCQAALISRLRETDIRVCLMDPGKSADWASELCSSISLTLVQQLHAATLPHMLNSRKISKGCVDATLPGCQSTLLAMQRMQNVMTAVVIRQHPWCSTMQVPQVTCHLQGYRAMQRPLRVHSLCLLAQCENECVALQVLVLAAASDEGSLIFMEC